MGAERVASTAPKKELKKEEPAEVVKEVEVIKEEKRMHVRLWAMGQ